ncbi:hypothetical protein EDD18DRAFT_1111006 [Armillaria luteobubalina]|uniref:Uncharacterized protein n=1 Tax=Armillaria luteobubalina TaxID=153913 RepID=A0AA39UKL2_9AGAR|nr:hypothetical protein EDD18DRAFT_1111006 [Armillaria luteobubalina]
MNFKDTLPITVESMKTRATLNADPFETCQHQATPGRYLQVELKGCNIHVSIMILACKLFPDNPFPTQLSEAQVTISTIFSAGAKPRNITLAEASAGRNVVLQLLTHILQPLPSVSPLPIPPSTPFCGVFPGSPCKMTSHSPNASSTQNTNITA